MSSSIWCLFGFSLTVFLASRPGVGQDPAMNERMNQKLATVTSESTSGVAILVSRDGKILVETAGGMADIEKKIPATAATQFRIGSVSKQFTAMAILRLAEQGKLSLQDPLKKYYPNMPNAASITLESLLTHTSGLKCYTSYSRNRNWMHSPDAINMGPRS